MLQQTLNDEGQPLFVIIVWYNFSSYKSFSCYEAFYTNELLLLLLLLFWFFPEALKTSQDKDKEEELLQQLVTVVHERSQLVDKMDDERQR